MKGENHYVDNKLFCKKIVEYIESVRVSEDKDEDPPELSDYLGDCFIKIAIGLSYKNNFKNYTFRDEFVGDAVENCLRAVENFDPRISSNAFAYFTQICYFAFLRRLQKEKKHFNIREKLISTPELFIGSSSKNPLDSRIYDNHQMDKAKRDFEHSRLENEKIENTVEKKRMITHKKRVTKASQKKVPKKKRKATLSILL